MLPPTFYDYDVLYGDSKMTLYVLRANMRPLPVGRCSIWHDGKYWVRATCWRNKHGKRYRRYYTLKDAMVSGINWARSHENEEQLAA